MPHALAEVCKTDALKRLLLTLHGYFGQPEPNLIVSTNVVIFSFLLCVEQRIFLLLYQGRLIQDSYFQISSGSLFRV